MHSKFFSSFPYLIWFWWRISELVQNGTRRIHKGADQLELHWICGQPRCFGPYWKGFLFPFSVSFKALMILLIWKPLLEFVKKILGEAFPSLLFSSPSFTIFFYLDFALAETRRNHCSPRWSLVKYCYFLERMSF